MFWLCKKALPHMPEGEHHQHLLHPGLVPVSRAARLRRDQGGIANFTKGLASMLGGKGIRVNSVRARAGLDAADPATMPEEKVESFGEQTPLGRVGQPAEVAPAFVFLASGGPATSPPRCSRSPAGARDRLSAPSCRRAGDPPFTRRG